MEIHFFIQKNSSLFLKKQELTPYKVLKVARISDDLRLTVGFEEQEFKL